MNELLSTLNPFVVFISLRDFLETGGPVLLWIMGVAFLMWTLILERYWYFSAAYPSMRKRVQDGWAARRTIVPGMRTTFAPSFCRK